jgi:hypothetical protein
MKKRKNYIIKSRVGDKKYIDWTKVKVTNTLPMSGEDITKNIYEQTGVKITRQGVSSAIKTAMKKVYKNIRRSNKTLTPFQAALQMFQILYAYSPSNKDAETFFNLLPNSIRKEIKERINDR